MTEPDKHSAMVFPIGPVRGGRIGDRTQASIGGWSRAPDLAPGDVPMPAGGYVSSGSEWAGRVPAIGRIVGTHVAGLSSAALRVTSRVLSDLRLTAPDAGAGSRLVRHSTRPTGARRTR